MPAAEPDTTPWVEEENTYESSPDSPDEVIVGEEAEKKMKEESMKMMWKALFALADARRVTTRWVRGHNGDPHNERADALANQGVEKALGR
jgi:ribonuclease HI